MDIFAQTIFVIGGAWTCLVGFLVLGMYRQNHDKSLKHKANNLKNLNNNGGLTRPTPRKFLAPTAKNRDGSGDAPSSTRRDVAKEKENGIKMA